MSKRKTIVIDELNIDKQNEYIDKISEIVSNMDHKPLALVRTYGCAQNENDSEKLRGYLTEMGYGITEDTHEADLILFNTCAVRGGAEDRVLGNLGALKHLKSKNKNLLLGICGCMMQEDHVAKKIRSNYPHVDIIFGTHTLYRFPQILYNGLLSKQRVFDILDIDGNLNEGVPQLRNDKFRAGVSIMYGCNNFCSYCIVPYVRGRERSRNKDDIISEISSLAQNGYKEITLLGQNVNSYGSNLDNSIDFADLLREINKIDGIKRIKFLTSHPKDISEKLMYTMADCENVCKYLHLPFQSGSNKILELMNRKYTKEKYLSLIEMARGYMKDITFTSDVIVGFPNETYADFLDTIDVIKKVEFDSLFTFKFSPREGTPAAKMEDSISELEKDKHFNMLLDVQRDISKKINDSYIDKTVEILTEGVSKNNPDMLSGRTNGNKIVNFKAKTAKEGDIVNVKITKSQTWALTGEEI